MARAIPGLFGPDALLDRLAEADRPVVFLLGSAVTAPVGDKPGVANVQGVVELARAAVGEGMSRTAARRAVKAFDDALAGASSGGQRYQRAIQQLKGRAGGADKANAVLRRAVLQARRVTATGVPDVRDIGALRALETGAELAGWYLGPAIKALGWLIARHPRQFGRAVLTTNFDPLVEVAIRAAGGQAVSVEILGDAPLPIDDPAVTPVIHLHGLWRSDTLHTPGTMTMPRLVLEDSLKRLFDGVTVVTVGYGGWDDVLMSTLSSLIGDTGARPDLLWCFFEPSQDDIARWYPRVTALLGGGLRERAVGYAGIDCHAVLPTLRARVDDEGDIIGRCGLCEELLDAFDAGTSIEIIGEPNMGRSDLLRWCAEQADFGGRRAARVNARELATPTPEALLCKIAESLGILQDIRDALYSKHAVPDEHDAARALGLLQDTWILVDDADALAVADHGFGDNVFFARLRAEIERGNLRWVSVSQQSLQTLFGVFGQDSPFLNNATKIYAGALDRAEVERALAPRLGRRAAEALACTGTLHRLVDRVCRADEDSLDAVLDGLSAWAAGLYAMWWQRAPEEQALLRRIARGEEMDAVERSRAGALCRRGLLVKTEDGRYTLNGHEWEAYVRAQG